MAHEDFKVWVKTDALCGITSPNGTDRAAL